MFLGEKKEIYDMKNYLDRKKKYFTDDELFHDSLDNNILLITIIL
jgi:hypothetical protein